MDARLLTKLVVALNNTPATGAYGDEGAFEREFVKPVCEEVLSRSMKLYVHPWKDKALGPDWRSSKEWGAIHAWGTVQAFDLLARDERGSEPFANGLAVEVKLSKGKGLGLPTGDFQRMLGQCLQARLIHPTVVGVFGYCGHLRKREPDRGEEYLQRLAAEFNIHVVLKPIGR